MIVYTAAMFLTRGMAAGVCASLTACSHTYIFAGDAPPRFEGGELVLAVPGEEVERYAIERVLVSPVRAAVRLPTTMEIRAWQIGDATPELDIIRVDVDTSGRIWNDWVLPGFGIGAGLIALTLGGVGAVEPEGSGGLTLPITMLLALVLGLEGAGIGGGLGALAEGGTTDMRFPGGARVGPPGTPWQSGSPW